jgi:ubiquinone/menaquinone biosynthesis C-methylase UbiE
MEDRVYFNAVHERLLTPIELAGLRSRRRTLLAHAHGRVLDLGGGCGDHFTSYPPSVQHVTVLGADPSLRDALARRAASATVPIELVAGSLPFDASDAGFDAVVTNFLLCTMAPLDAVVVEIRRLLVDDGVLLACEHVPGRGVRALLASLMRPAIARLTPGCDQSIDVLMELRSQGFSVIDAQRFSLATAVIQLQSCVTLVAHPRRNRRPKAPDAQE